MDILRVLSAPDLEVRKKTLTLALDLVSSRNIEEVLHEHFLFNENSPPPMNINDLTTYIWGWGVNRNTCIGETCYRV